MKYDIIIIGAGLGGLTAGAKLAKEGRKVLVIEQHSKPGGCATTFRRGDYTLEVGLHEMDSPSAGDMKTRIFNDLDVFNNVEFIRLPEFYHFINGRNEITIPHNHEIAIERLSELFPEEISGIKTYFKQILTPKKKDPANAPTKDISVGEFLDSIIQNEDLKLVLLGNLGYFHDDPYSLSLAYYSVAQGSYFIRGGSFIKTGSQKLSDHFADFIKTHGGEVILNHTVTEIIISKNKVVGVSYKKKNIPDAEAIIALGDEIIANSAVPDLAGMLPEKYSTEFNKEIAGEAIGPSLLTIYFGFKKPLRELGNNYYSTFVYDDSVKTQADILKNNKDDFSRRNFTFIDYSQIDSGLAPSGKSVGALCCIDYLKDWEKLGPKEYKSEKEIVARVFIDRLEKIIPGIKDVIEYYEVGTSATVKRYTLNPGGAVHGFVQTPSRKFINSFKSLDNLHFASAWGKTGGGYSGVIYGGQLCALNILRKKPGNIKK
jgi:all-trans-retinol 13,14-reductase